MRAVSTGSGSRGGGIAIGGGAAVGCGVRIFSAQNATIAHTNASIDTWTMSFAKRSIKRLPQAYLNALRQRLHARSAAPSPPNRGTNSRPWSVQFAAVDTAHLIMTRSGRAANSLSSDWRGGLATQNQQDTCALSVTRAALRPRLLRIPPRGGETPPISRSNPRHSAILSSPPYAHHGKAFKFQCFRRVC